MLDELHSETPSELLNRCRRTADGLTADDGSLWGHVSQRTFDWGWGGGVSLQPDTWRSHPSNSKTLRLADKQPHFLINSAAKFPPSSQR